jgi:hypothetical protein
MHIVHVLCGGLIAKPKKLQLPPNYWVSGLAGRKKNR